MKHLKVFKSFYSASAKHNCRYYNSKTYYYATGLEISNFLFSFWSSKSLIFVSHILPFPFHFIKHFYFNNAFSHIMFIIRLSSIYRNILIKLTHFISILELYYGNMRRITMEHNILQVIALAEN